METVKRNVTISLDESVLKAIRLKAAASGVSFQEFVRKALAQMVQATAPDSLQEFWDLADRVGAKSDGKYLKREELYDREVLRRHERLLVRERHEVAKETGKRKKAPRKARKG
jgi:hypothetical protein